MFCSPAITKFDKVEQMRYNSRTMINENQKSSPSETLHSDDELPSSPSLYKVLAGREAKLGEQLTANLSSLGEILAGQGDNSPVRPPFFEAYRVPLFQRSYAWGVDQWTDLWLDLEDLEKEDKSGNRNAVHYMGHLILAPRNGEAQVIDGQQRLATLVILMLACAERLDFPVDTSQGEEKNRLKVAAEELRAAYAGDWDSVTKSVSRPRLILNRNDDDFFRAHILNPEFPHPEYFSGRPPSNQRLWKALKFFRDKLRPPKGERGGRNEQDTERLADIAEKRLVFTAIHVDNELNAYRVFETLNARGVDLSAGDLIKNLLLRKAQGLRQEEMERQWNAAEREVGGRNMADYLVCLWNSERERAEGRALYRRLRAEIQTAEEAFKFVSRAAERAPTYSALLSPTTESLKDKETVRTLATLAVDFGARQHLPMLLTARRLLVGDKLKPAGFYKLARWAEIAHFRHIVIARQPSAFLEFACNRAALALLDAAKSEDRNANENAALPEVLKILSDATVNDGVFRQHFKDAWFDARDPDEKRIVRYILRALELHMGAPGDLRDPSIEHILPVGAGDHWPAFPAETRETYVQRLGNYCFLTEEDNHEKCGGKPYDEKKAVYKNSAYRTAREWLYDEWTPQNLLDRQEHMADLAVEIWRLE